jgi:replicative DNA helicase
LNVTSEILDRLPPCDLDAESAVIGSILLGARYDDVCGIIGVDDFYSAAHCEFWKAFVDMDREGVPLNDFMLVMSHLRYNGGFEKVGGAAYIAKVLRTVPNKNHAVYYSKIVKRHSVARQVIQLATQMLREGYEETDEPTAIIARYQLEMNELAAKATGGTTRGFLRVASDALASVDECVAGGRSAGVSTGLVAIDGILSGLRPDELIILAARPSMGKTALAAQIALNVAKDNHHVAFISLEMEAHQLALRLMCAGSQVNTRRMSDGTMDAAERKRLVESIVAMGNPSLHIDDSARQTVDSIAGTCRKLHNEHGSLGLVVIDYLTKIEPDDRRMQRNDQVELIVSRLKELAKTLHVPVLVLAQLNRDNESNRDKRPKLSQLRASGAIEQDADVVMFIHREDYYKSGGVADGKAEIIVAKQRNGPTGVADLQWQPIYTRFVDDEVGVF